MGECRVQTAQYAWGELTFAGKLLFVTTCMCEAWPFFGAPETATQIAQATTWAASVLTLRKTCTCVWASRPPASRLQLTHTPVLRHCLSASPNGSRQLEHQDANFRLGQAITSSQHPSSYQAQSVRLGDQRSQHCTEPPGHTATQDSHAPLTCGRCCTLQKPSSLMHGHPQYAAASQMRDAAAAKFVAQPCEAVP